MGRIYRRIGRTATQEVKKRPPVFKAAASLAPISFAAQAVKRLFAERTVFRKITEKLI
jgi:hypothetical protein